MLIRTIEPRHFDSDGLSSEETWGLASSIFGSVFGELSFVPAGNELGPVRGVFCKVMELQVMTCFFTPEKMILRGQGDRQSDSLFMVRSMEGPLVVNQGGQVLEAESGDFLFFSASDAFELTLPRGGRIDCGSMPIEAFPAPRAALDKFLLRPIPKSHPPLQLLITHGAYLLMRGVHAPGEAELIFAHFKQILPLVLEYLEKTRNADAGDRLARIKALVEERLSDVDLDVSTVARSLGVTPRYVQKLFQAQGTTFSRHLLERRLEVAHSHILGAGQRRSISAIAYELGFGDLSYFNRTFRRRFGKTPSELRGVS